MTNHALLQNRYRIISPLGTGGMGAVYKAWDTRLNVFLAIKEMVPPTDLDDTLLAKLREQFRQEATILAQLDHPNLVGVTDFFEESEKAFLVMKFVEGESLSAHIQRVGMLAEDVVLTLAAQLLDALFYCHNQGVIHRDIKPQNIILRPNGQAVLVDFGLSKLWNPGDPRTKTVMRGMGTPEYAPPEQYDADLGHTDPRSDIYSLGATLYHALAGKAPPTATLRIANPECFSKAWTHVKGVSVRTRSAITKALELARSQRWDNALAMASALGLTIAKGENGALAASAFGGTQKITEVIPPGSGTARGGAPKPRISLPVWGIALASIVVIALGLVIAGIVTGALPQLLKNFAAPTMVVGQNVRSTETPDTPFSTTSPSAATLLPTATITPTPTFTPGPRPTSTRTPRITATPTATSAQESASALSLTSLTPSVRASAVPVKTPSVNATTTSVPAASGAWFTFEDWGSWTRGNQPYGELTQSREQIKSGRYAAKLTYNFPTVQDDYLVFRQSRGISGEPNTIGTWVYGDGSGHFLNIWIQDAQNQIWAVHLGNVGQSGWRQMVGWLAPGLPWPSGHISGPDNGIVDYPVRFYALVLDRPDRGPQRGQIYIDDISAWRGTPPTPVPTGAPTTVATTTPEGTLIPALPSGTVTLEIPPGVVVPSAPQLMAPKNDETLDNPITFQWMGLLGPGQSYVVHAQNVEPGHGYAIDSPPLSTSVWTIEVPGEAFGEWRWEVRVVQNGVVLTTSSEGKFWVDPFLHRD